MPTFYVNDIQSTGLTNYGVTTFTGTGNNFFSVSGASGAILTVNDTPSATLFSVSTTGGTTIFSVTTAGTRFNAALYDSTNSTGSSGNFLVQTTTGPIWSSATVSAANIYTTDGALGGNRLVSMNGNTLKFSGLTGVTLFMTGSNNNYGVVIGGATFDPIAPEALAISASNQTSYNVVSAHANLNNYAQLNMQNFSNGSNASADIVVTNNIGTENSFYVDLGINSSGFAGSIGGPNDSYLYASNNDFYIGTLGGAASDLRFFVNTGSTADVILSGGTGNMGIGVGNTPPSNKLVVSAATDPVRFVGLATATSGNTNNSVITIDNTGVLRVGSNTFIGNDGKLEVTSISALTVPISSTTASRVGIFNTQSANRSFVTQIGNYGTVGLDTALMQPLLAKKNIGYWNPPGNATTTPAVFGFTAPTVSGTATARSVTTSGLVNRIKRLSYVSAAGATAVNALAFQYQTTAQVTCGTGTANTISDGSGFYSVSRFVQSNTASVPLERFFCGFSSSVAQPTNVEPNTLTNCVGIAKLSTDTTQYYLVYGGSVAQTAIPMGTALGTPTGQTTDAIEFAIYSPQSLSATYFVQATNLVTNVKFSTVVSGTSTVVPPSGTLLAWRIWKGPNSAVAASSYDLSTVYIETDT